MHLTLKFDTVNIDWNKAAEIYRAAGFEGRDAAGLKFAFDAAHAVCFAYDMDKLIGLGRVAPTVDGHALLDLCIYASYKGFGLGHTMHDYLARKVEGPLPILYGNDAELAFYKAMELDELLG
ncbi:MAG: GNAT family N-acetyltransferase [Desulfovibrio sp.]